MRCRSLLQLLLFFNELSPVTALSAGRSSVQRIVGQRRGSIPVTADAAGRPGGSLEQLEWQRA